MPKRNSGSNPGRRPLLTVLLWTGAAVVVTVSVAINWTYLFTQRYVHSGYYLEIRALFVLALVTLGLMFFESPRGASRGLLKLKGVLFFAAATLLLCAIMAAVVKVGLRGFWVLAFYPLVWLASSILGLAAARRVELPLSVAAAGAWIAVAGGFLAYSYEWGLRWPFVEWYAMTAEKVGGWRPVGGEAFRATGFDVDPNYYGLLGVVVLSFVLGFEEHRRVRLVAAVGAALVVAMSGSRTAVVATLLVMGVWATTLVIDRKNARVRFRDSYGVATVILSTMIALMILVPLSSASSGVARRASLSAADAATKTSASSALDALTGGRVEIWRQGIHVYAEQPLGWYVPAGLLLQGRSTHNEYLKALIEGGPLYLAAYLVFLTWIAFALHPVGARSAGLLLATGIGSSALMLTPMGLGPVMCMGLYFVGWLSGQKKTVNAASV